MRCGKREPEARGENGYGACGGRSSLECHGVQWILLDRQPQATLSEVIHSLLIPNFTRVADQTDEIRTQSAFYPSQNVTFLL